MSGEYSWRVGWGEFTWQSMSGEYSWRVGWGEFTRRIMSGNTVGELGGENLLGESCLKSLKGGHFILRFIFLTYA